MEELIGLSVAVLTVMILLLLRKNLGLVMLIGSLILAAFSRVSWADGLAITQEALFSTVTINLLLVIVGISMISDLMYRSGGIDKVIGALKSLIADTRILLMIIPALIGLVAIPGGAYFSSPMVKEVGKGTGLSPARLALVNVFFRHVFFFVFPLFSGFLGMVEMSGIPPLKLLSFNTIPLLISLVIGFYVIFRGSGKGEGSIQSESSRWQSSRELLYGLSPLLLAVIVFIIIGWPFWIGIIIGIAVSLSQCLPSEGKRAVVKERLFRLPRSIPFSLLGGVLSVMLFKEFIVHSNAILLVADYSRELGIPVLLMIVVLPFLTGAVTGNCLAALGIALPVLLPLMGSTTGSMAALIYLGSLWGYLVSPVHLCQILTVEYFKVRLTDTMFPLFWIGCLVIAISTAVFLLF